MDEIDQELTKYAKSKVKFSFNPHILPIFRGMMSTIYCELNDGITNEDILDVLLKFYSNATFVKILSDDSKNDFFSIQNTNNCIIRLLKQNDEKRIIITSVIDNLLKGGSGQAVQNMNLIYNFKENEGLNVKN